MALDGVEKSDSTTLVNFALGLPKSEALKILEDLSVKITNIFFDDDSKKFYKQDLTKYGSFNINESAKTPLTHAEVSQNWKEFALKNPESFLNLNESYKKINQFIRFIENKKETLGLSEVEFKDEKKMAFEIVKKVCSVISEFHDFTNCDINYYLDEILPQETKKILDQLPSSLTLPNGKSVKINYTDPKSPLISAKIQDCFGWRQTPTLLNGLLKITIELLAPNMRPTQITQNLESFWSHSYLDIRKELKARYPKHNWPEKPN